MADCCSHIANLRRPDQGIAEGDQTKRQLIQGLDFDPGDPQVSGPFLSKCLCSEESGVEWASSWRVTEYAPKFTRSLFQGPRIGSPNSGSSHLGTFNQGLLSQVPA